MEKRFVISSSLRESQMDWAEPALRNPKTRHMPSSLSGLGLYSRMRCEIRRPAESLLDGDEDKK